MKKSRLHRVLLLCSLAFFSFINVNELKAQVQVITGKVTLDAGTPADRATVSVKGTQGGTTTDASGAFTIKVPSPVSTLVISYLGYTTQEIALKNRTIIEVALEPSTSSTSMESMVVVGYGTQRRKDLTGSVASLKGDVFKNQPITNATEALQGRIAGVNIVKSSGAPDAQPSIIIRGLASLNQPNPLYIVDNIRVNDISSLNVQDIESMDVLKDAAAAAIYGAAAAGGVILVTTKKGTSSKPQFNYNVRYGVTTPKTGELLDKNGYVRLQNIVNPDRFKNATKLDTLANTNWIDETFQNANEQNHNLSMTGSTPVVNYLLSAFYNKQDGVARKNFSNIGGARINTNFNLGKFIKIGEQVAISRRKTSSPQDVGVEAQLHNAPFRTLPIIPVTNSDGTYGGVPPGYGIAFGGTHPVGAVDNAFVENYKNNLQANVYAEVKLPLDLTFRTNIGYSYYNETQNYFQNAFAINGVGSPTNSLTKSSLESQQLLTNYILTYNKKLGDHTLNLVGGFEQITGKFNNVIVKSSNINADAGKEFALITTESTNYLVTGQRDNNKLIKSWFGRLNYNYAGKYFVSASIRQDADYAVFGPAKQKGVFPAASVGWTVSEEPFFKNAAPAIDLLKIRASYGELGNSNIGSYNYLGLYKPFTSFGNGSAGGANFSNGAPIIPGVTLANIPNPAFHWETVQEFNVGIDGELLNHKLYFSAEFYNKKTIDLIYNLPLAPSAGIQQDYVTNIGTVKNRGFELLLGYRSQVGKVGFDVSVTGGWNKNELTKLSNETSSELFDGYNFYNNGDKGFQIMPNLPITVSKQGLPFGSFYGYKSLGLFATDAEAATQKVNGNVAHAGDIHYEDLDKNGDINDKDRQVIGNPNPKLVYGISARVNFKGFDASFLFNGVAGVDLFNGVKAYEMKPFSDGNTSPKVWGASFLDKNGLTDQPRLGVVNGNGSFNLDPNGNYSTVNSYFVENGNYLKLKNLQFGYTFSLPFMQKISVRSARLFIMGNNLLTITKYSGLDPELGASFSPSGLQNVTARGIDVVSQYPQTRIYSVGLDLNF